MRQFRDLWILAALFSVVPAFLSFGESLAPIQAPVVGSIAFQVASPYMISYEELAGLITIRPGDPLSPFAVRESIRRLHRKSLFRELAAYVREEEGRAQILFYLRPLPVVTEIGVFGQKRVLASQILAASRIRRGTPVEEDDLSRAQEAVLSLLRSKGFLDASVTVSAACNMENGTGKVRIEVREGSPALVKEVRVPGAAFFPPGKLEDLLGVAIDSPFDFRKWEKGVNRLRGAYKREGFLTVHVSEPGVSCEDGEGLCLAARVEEGPRYEILWEGASRFSVGKLEKASGIYAEEGEFTEGGLVHDLKERLLSFYRERDHFRASVDVEAEGKPDGGRRLTIVIREGKAGYLKQVRFSGNANISAKSLRKQMLSTERGLLHPITGSGAFDDREWNDDLAALIGLYQKDGFARARISSVDTEWDDRGGITATIHIDEGMRYRLREIQFRGNDHYLREELLRLIGNRENQYVDFAGLDRDGEAIAEHYRNEGYLDVSVEARFEPDEEKSTAVIRFTIAEGPRYLLGKIAVRGNLLTDPVVVFREVTIPEGAPAGEKDLLTFQQAVFGTGLFRTVRLNRVKRPAEGVVDLVVEVEEALFFEFEYGSGYGTDTGIRGFVGTRHRNLNGRGRRLYARIVASQKEQSYLADLREPWVLGNRWKWEGGVTASHQEAERESFSLKKTSVVTSINKTIFRRSSVSVQYELSRDDVFDVAQGAVLSREDQGSATISTVRGLFVLDLRDDPFNPKRGSFNSGSVEFATSFLGSEVDYYKLVGQSSWYFPWFRRNTLVLSGRAGVVRPLRDTEEVPIQKRFFLGGRTTVRGFDEESLGPLGPDGAPTGGEYMVNGNAELRFPLKHGFILATFLDAGSVWFRGDPEKDFDLRESAGLGLRYVTPVGPVSLDYGWKLDRQAGESPSEWHFTIGAVF
ncbi:MAG TPA: outer membrane protein assembly factor BamA [Candidatus Deferrimicrobiaceae bacterium]|nr:outer membrane protein assembly factor BamA [Candidatus Deferrimicrobiaceae bacterium]